MRGVATTDRNDAGGFVLQRTLAIREKELLRQRSVELAPWLQPADRRKVAAAIAAWLIGFGTKSTTPDEAKAVITEYVQTLDRIPWWALERTLQRFREASVRPEEIGTKSIDWSFAPSAVQVRMVAVELMRPYGEENTRIWMLLRGTMKAPEPTDEQRAADKRHIAEGLEAFKRDQAQRQLDEAEADAQRRDRIEAGHRENSLRILRQEYIDAGLQPPEGNEPVSLAMLIRAGWTIEDGPEDEKVLIKPGSLSMSPGTLPVTRPAKQTTARNAGDIAAKVLESAVRTGKP